MPTNITINNITGTTPFNIYLCDNLSTVCVYIDTISTFPYSFDVPTIMDSQNEFNLKIVDNNGCVKYDTLSV